MRRQNPEVDYETDPECGVQGARVMSWEYVLNDARAANTAQTTEPAMDAEAFAGFYERSARQLWAYLARVSGDASLAEDLMQESYVRFLCASAPQDGEVAARRYLFRIASNLLR